MECKSQLRIGLIDYQVLSQTHSLNSLTGGPSTLLDWLEIQLGLRTTGVQRANRITEFANLLDGYSSATFSKSLAVDRWATASELLDRFDNLMVSGWNAKDSESLPQLVRDIAKAVDGRKLEFPSEAARLSRVLLAFESGQTLPPHECVLLDEPDLWPSLWQAVLSQINCVPFITHESSAPVGTNLRYAQDIVRGLCRESISPDDSLRHVVTRSEAAACDFVANVLAHSSDDLTETVVYCADRHLALRLDATLHRVGLPTMGASLSSPAHPVLQVLPLALSLCWEPVNPQSLLDFLSLPVRPLSPSVAKHLASALVEQPGFGSSRWAEAVEEVCGAEWDSDGKIRKTLNEWLYIERVARGTDITTSKVREVCGRVAKWATGRSLLLDKDLEENTDLYEAFRTAANQASFLGELAESQGRVTSEPQLKRLLEEATASGVKTQPFIEADSAPTLVGSLAEIGGKFKRLIWIGLSVPDAPLCSWSSQNIKQLRTEGIDIDDGSRKLSALRSAEARGLGYIQESMLAIHLPQDWEQRLHPLWLAIQNGFPKGYEPPAIESLIEQEETSFLSPYTFSVDRFCVIKPQPERSHWEIGDGLLHDRTTVSASELQDRLGCPLKWVFNYQAKLKPSSIAQLPEDHQLKGTFCHSILEEVFAGNVAIPSVDEAVTAIGAMFDSRLPKDAAPLAQPDKRIEREKLRSQLIGATRTLISALHDGGYERIDIEVELDGAAFGKELVGSVDCVATNSSGAEAVIDFKYSGKRYREMLKDGRAIQLATYAYGRSAAKGFPSVAYLIISDGSLCTPEGNPVSRSNKTDLVDGPAIQSVWEDFEQAVTAADGWLSGEIPVPARPLIATDLWPAGLELVLDGSLKNGESQSVCRYCNYTQLCGLARVE